MIFSGNFFQFDQDLFRGLRYTTRATKLGRRLCHVTSLVLLRQRFGSFRPLPVERHVVIGKDLVIKDTRQEDRGPYMCRGENHLGHVYALIVLVVKPVSKWIKC